MVDDRWERWTFASGIVYALSFVLGMFLMIGDEIDSASDGKILSYYADGANRVRVDAGFALVLLSALSLLVFVSALHHRFRSAQPEPRLLPTLMFGAGTAVVALQVGAAALFTGTAATVDLSNNFVVDPNVVRLAFGVGFGVFYASVAAMLVIVVATSTLAFRTSALPRWLGWFGGVAIVVALLEAVLFPLFVVPAWILVVSIVLLKPARVPELQRQGLTA